MTEMTMTKITVIDDDDDDDDDDDAILTADFSWNSLLLANEDNGGKRRH
jgi:hypothetical protein